MSGSIYLRSQGNEPVPAPGGGGGSDAIYETGAFSIQNETLAIGATRTFVLATLGAADFTNGWLTVREGEYVQITGSAARVAHIMFTTEPADGFAIASVFGSGGGIVQQRGQSMMGFYQAEDGFLSPPNWGTVKTLQIERVWLAGAELRFEITNLVGSPLAATLDLRGRFYVLR